MSVLACERRPQPSAGSGLPRIPGEGLHRPARPRRCREGPRPRHRPLALAITHGRHGDAPAFREAATVVPGADRPARDHTGRGPQRQGAIVPGDPQPPAAARCPGREPAVGRPNSPSASVSAAVAADRRSSTATPTSSAPPSRAASTSPSGGTAWSPAVTRPPPSTSPPSPSGPRGDPGETAQRSRGRDTRANSATKRAPEEGGASPRDRLEPLVLHAACLGDDGHHPLGLRESRADSLKPPTA